MAMRPFSGGWVFLLVIAVVFFKELENHSFQLWSSREFLLSLGLSSVEDKKIIPNDGRSLWGVGTLYGRWPFVNSMQLPKAPYLRRLKRDGISIEFMEQTW